MIVSSGHRGINFLNDYDEANEEERRWLSLANDRPNGIMKNSAPRKSKYYINTLQFPTSQRLWLYSPIDDSVERKQIASFIFGFSRSQKFLPESSYDGVSGTDNDELWTVVKQLSKCLLSLVARSRFSWFQNGNILLVNASCKRRALIIKHLLLLIIVNRVIFNRLVTM